MLQRTKGRFLLALLVISGLAGTTTSNPITKEERKHAISEMKSGRDAVMTTTEKLSPEQWNYKPSPDRWSVKECVTHIALTEDLLWQNFEKAAKAPANPDFRDSIKVTDEALEGMMKDRSTKRTASEQLQPSHGNFNNGREALNAFRDSRNAHIKYVKNTTEDLRNHVTRFGPGWIDSYQALLTLNGHSERHLAQIREVMASPGFPKR